MRKEVERDELPIMAGLGALIGGLVNKKKKTQEGSGAWRV